MAWSNDDIHDAVSFEVLTVDSMKYAENSDGTRGLQVETSHVTSSAMFGDDAGGEEEEMMVVEEEEAEPETGGTGPLTPTTIYDDTEHLLMRDLYGNEETTSSNRIVDKLCVRGAPCHQRTTECLVKHATSRRLFMKWLTPLRALIVLTCINTTIYMDRGNIGGVLAPIEKDFELESWQTGMVWGAFMVAYMIASPVLARLAQRYTAVGVMSAGILIMALSAFFTLFSTGFWSLFFARAFVGFGEASYASLSSPYIKKIAPADRYHTWLGIYFAAMPIGAAFGYVMGGVTSTFFHWKLSFFIEFIVLIVAASVCSLFPKASELRSKGISAPYEIPEFLLRPSQKQHTVDVDYEFEGKHEAEEAEEAEEEEELGSPESSSSSPPPEEWYGGYLPSREQYESTLALVGVLWRNQPYVFVTLGCAALNFVAGAFVFWCPIYIHEELGASLVVATSSVGVLTVFFGIAGALFGGRAVDYITAVVMKEKSGRAHKTLFILDRNTRPPEFASGEDTAHQHFQWMKIVVASRFAILLSVTQIVVMVAVTMVYSYGWFFFLFGLAEFLLFALISPVNALVMDVVKDEHREFAVGMQIFVSHLIGDLPSPIILGLIRQHFDLRAAMYLLTAWFAWVTLWFWNVDHEYRKGEEAARKWTWLRLTSVTFFAAFPYLLLASLSSVLLFTADDGG